MTVRYAIWGRLKLIANCVAMQASKAVRLMPMRLAKSLNGTMKMVHEMRKMRTTGVKTVQTKNAARRSTSITAVSSEYDSAAVQPVSFCRTTSVVTRVTDSPSNVLSGLNPIRVGAGTNTIWSSVQMNDLKIERAR